MFLLPSPDCHRIKSFLAGFLLLTLSCSQPSSFNHAPAKLYTPQDPPHPSWNSFPSFIEPHCPDFLSHTLLETNRSITSTLEFSPNSRVKRRLLRWLKQVTDLHSQQELHNPLFQKKLKKNLSSFRTLLFWPGQTLVKKNTPIFWNIFEPKNLSSSQALHQYLKVTQSLINLLFALEIQHPEGHWFDCLMGVPLNAFFHQKRTGWIPDADTDWSVLLHTPFRESLEDFSSTKQSQKRVSDLKNELSETFLDRELKMHQNTAIQALQKGEGQGVWFPLSFASQKNAKIGPFLGQWSAALSDTHSFWEQPSTVNPSSIFLALANTLQLPPSVHTLARLLLNISRYTDISLLLGLWKDHTHFFPVFFLKATAISTTAQVTKYLLLFQKNETGSISLLKPPALLIQESDCKTPAGCLQFKSTLVPFE